MATTELTDPVPTRSKVGAVVALTYAVASYAAFILVFLYAVAFLADVVVARTVDRGGAHGSGLSAVLIDALLLGVFAVQHSVMARPGFKARWTRTVPRHVERATYVLASSAALALAFWQWHPIPSVAWDVDWSPARWLLWSLQVVGWLWVLAMSFAIDHFDLFGLRQVARHLRGLADQPPAFVLPLPYRLCRHPMMLGFIVAFVATPTMTVGHLLFAALGCAYIVVGVRLEERDLGASFPEYDAYAATTPRLVPRKRLRGR
jgi:protein-S-isoprenylcysteine O-methyltransferase Ste14